VAARRGDGKPPAVSRPSVVVKDDFLIETVQVVGHIIYV